MNEYIAYCGLDCETCEARQATVNNDDELRVRAAKLWSELNGVEITPEMINCTGCRIPGVKTPYCDSLCPIRQCAMKKQVETCGSCPEMKSCEKVGAIISNNPDRRHLAGWKTPERSKTTSEVVCHPAKPPQRSFVTDDTFRVTDVKARFL